MIDRIKKDLFVIKNNPEKLSESSVMLGNLKETRFLHAIISTLFTYTIPCGSSTCGNKISHAPLEADRHMIVEIALPNCEQEVFNKGRRKKSPHCTTDNA